MVSTRLIHHANEIDFSKESSYVLLSKNTNENLLNTIKQIPFPDMGSFVWVLTSGTSSKKLSKLIGLSKDAIFASAKSVNKHLRATDSDVWLNVLPTHHVGGLSIYIRAMLTKVSVVDISTDKWSVDNFVDNVIKNQITLSALVPTQLIDLVNAKIKAPASLRAIVIGGGALSEAIYKQARSLGWPVLPSFGMTETCSQIATASLESLSNHSYPELEILEHAECRLSKDEFLEVKCSSLFKCQIHITPEDVLLLEPEFDWYKTQDYADLKDGHLKPKGRGLFVKKVSGGLVNLTALEEVFSEIKPQDLDSVLVFNNNPRKENQVDLVVTDLKGVDNSIEKFNSRVKPYEQIENVYCVKEIPKTDLGKVKYTELLGMINN